MPKLDRLRVLSGGVQYVGNVLPVDEFRLVCFVANGWIDAVENPVFRSQSTAKDAFTQGAGTELATA